MVARLAISSAGRNGQYVGTTKAVPPSSVPGSASARYFNGTRDRLVGRRSSDLGQNYLMVMSFWRADSTILADNQTAARLFTQYTIGNARVAVGLNRSFLSLTYTTNTGESVTRESVVRVLDVDRHTLALHVSSTSIVVYLDGREAIRATATLGEPDYALTTIGSDGGQRFFKGYIDDVAFFQAVPNSVANWVRFYRALTTGLLPRDYTSAPFAPGFSLLTLSEQNFTATGTLNSPPSRVAMSVPWRTEPELNEQYIELTVPTGPSNSYVQIGVMNANHDLSTQLLGATANSYVYTQDGRLRSDGNDVVTNIINWSPATNVMALGWRADTRTMRLLKDGVEIHIFTLPAGSWTPAITVGSNVVRVNAGQSPWRSLPKEATGLHAVASSRLTTELRHLKLAEVTSALTDTDVSVRDLATGTIVGTYLGSRQTYGSISPDSLDRSTRVGDGIKINFGPHTTAGAGFFFALAFQPTEDDLVGEKVLFESPGSWGLKLLDGRVFAWCGEVQVGSVNPAFDAGKSYLVGMTRAASGKLLVWCHVGYMLQSGDVTVAQPTADLFIGAKQDGSAKFAGKVAQIVLSTATPPSWKLERFRRCYEWEVPNIAGLLPNPATERLVFEPSYRDVLATGIAASPSTGQCYVAALASAPDALAVGFRMVSREGVNPYAGEFIKPWSIKGRLASRLSRLGVSAAVVEFDDLSAVTVGQAVLIDNEICRIDALNRTTGEMTLARGCVDTVPAEHAAGARVWFYEPSLASTKASYPANRQVEVKLLSRSELSELPEEMAPVDVVSTGNRLSRPYPPANVTINDQVAPTMLTGTVQVKWRHRNRVAQGASLVAYTEAGGTAPATVTYLVRMFNAETSELLHESSPQASTVDNYDLYVEHFGDVTVTVSSLQDGLECLQVPALSFVYDNRVDVVITTEEGEPLETEDDTANVFAETETTMRVASYSGELPDDYVYEEEEEEELNPAAGELTEGSGHIMGVKISEFPEAQGLVGDELVPLVKGDSNRKTTLTDLINHIMATLPPPENGKSAYEIAVERGFQGSEDQWLAQLIGAEGPSSNMSRRILNVSSASGAVVCDWSKYDEIRLRLTGPVTLTFQGARDGQGCMLKVQQDINGGWSVTLPNSVRYNALIQRYDATPVPGIADKIGFIYDSADGSYDFVSMVPGITF